MKIDKNLVATIVVSLILSVGIGALVFTVIKDHTVINAMKPYVGLIQKSVQEQQIKQPIESVK